MTLAPARPIFRGYLHAGAALAAVAGGTYLVLMSNDDPGRQLSMLVYAVGLTLLFACSAVYHVRTWPPATHAILRRVDHANIFVVIAATNTPIAFNLLSGWWRGGVLGAVWGAALVGVGAEVADVTLQRWLRTGLFLGMGWVTVAAVPQLTAVLPWTAIGLLGTGGALYSLGALIYAGKRPDPWPRMFGYHEVFHLFTVAAGVAFYIVIAVYVLPAPRR